MARLSWRFVFTLFLLDYNMMYTEATQRTTRLTTTVTMPSTRMITTVPLPPGGCFVDGKVYKNDETISKDSGGCGGTVCIDGEIAYWDAWCMFYSSTTTPPPTTIPITRPPSVPPGGCVYGDQVYANGQKFNTDRSGCGGMMCDQGEILHWDDWCMFFSSTTTPPPTTVPRTTTSLAPPGGCVYEDKVYLNGQKFNIDSSGCGGMMCNYGEVIYWDAWCMFYSSTPETTTSPPPPTTIPPSPPTTTPVTTTPPPSPTTTTTTSLTTTGVTTTRSGCMIRNTFYTLNSRTNTDPCNKCYCTRNGEVCTRTICDDVTNCVFKFRLKGDCCFICSGVDGTHHSQSFLLILPLLVLFFW